MKTISYGTLPTLSALTNLGAHPPGVSPRDVLTIMRASLQRLGPTEGLHALLKACGFMWAEPTVTELDLDVAAVRDALDEQQRATAEALASFSAADNTDEETR